MDRGPFPWTSKTLVTKVRVRLWADDGQAGSYRFVRRIGTKKRAIIPRFATSEITGGWPTSRY